MPRFEYVLLTIFCYVHLSSEQKSEAIRGVISDVGRDISGLICDDVTHCKMMPAESLGCHFYKNTETMRSGSCLVETYTGKSPSIYVKPSEDFDYLEINIYNRVCIDSKVFGIGKIGDWKLHSDLFPDHGTWYEIQVQAVEMDRRYHLHINGEHVRGINKPHKYKKLNNTHIQIMTKGSAIWSFECDPRNYESLPSSSLVPWIMFFTLAILLLITLICIVIYCSKKLKKQTRSVSDWSSLRFSSRSTVSLISSPSVFGNQSSVFRGSVNSSCRDITQGHTRPSTSIVQNWSCNESVNKNSGAQGWSYTTQGCSGRASKMGSKPNVIPEHVYEEIEEDAYHVYDNPNEDTNNPYENPEEHIYQEINDFAPVVSAEPSRPNTVPYTRANSSVSAFSTANSIYGCL